MTWSPSFRPCPECGELTAGNAKCFDCTRLSDRRSEAVRMFENSIPAGFKWARFDSPELAQRVSDRVVLAGRNAVECRRVVLTGPSGTGKTSLAIAMARARVRTTAKGGAFTLATDLGTARRRSQLGREAPEVSEALTVPILVLDDLGTDAPDPNSAVTEVIFKRHAEDRVTWITTWMTPEQMTQRYGDGVTRRVFESARVVAFEAGQ